MFLKLLLTVLIITVGLPSPSMAGLLLGAPELDNSSLSMMAAAFAGLYAGFRIYKLKNKS